MKAKKAQPPFVNFSVAREYLDRNGIWNPRDKTPPLKEAFQVNVFGSRAHYLQLAEFFREFAERDTSTDGDYHDHFEGLMSTSGNVRLHVILRKDTWAIALGVNTPEAEEREVPRKSQMTAPAPFHESFAPRP
jgi:hypothetical protein